MVAARLSSPKSWHEMPGKRSGKNPRLGKGRYLSCNWDVDELTPLKDQIIQDDLLVNRLRTKA
jgi:hypothetical protein